MTADRHYTLRHLAVRRAIAALACATLLTVAATATAAAQRFYDSPEDAAGDLVKTAESDGSKPLLRVLGRGGADIVSSGDEVADAEIRKRFIDEYKAKHSITMEADDRALLVVGLDDFPFPIPLVRKAGRWQFNTAAGRREVLARRIGRNELSAIQTSLAYVDAQHEYAEQAVDGAGVYAQRIASRPGKKDGLYWPSIAGQAESPLGAFAARAAAEGYQARKQRSPYHGYYYKILSRQGSSASGGVLDYKVNGKMIGGFAMVAFPANYGVTGVMTFLVNHQGVVYEKDLGPGTARRVPTMTLFNPDKTWRRVEPAAEGGR